MCKADTPVWSFRKEQDPLTLSYPLEYNENGAHPQTEAAALISSGNHLHAYLDKLQSDPETQRAAHTESTDCKNSLPWVKISDCKGPAMVPNDY